MSAQRVYVFPFRFGLSASELLAGEYLQSHLAAASLVSAGPCDLLQESVETIAVDNATMRTRPEVVYNEFFARLRSLTTRPDIVVVDLMQGFPIARGVPLIHLAHAIDTACNEENAPKYILAVDALPPEADPVSKILNDRIASGSVVVLSKDGGVRSATELGSVQAYKLKLMAFSLSPAERLELKLVRSLGHFKRKSSAGEHYRCCRHFYDARFCIDELTQLLKSFVREKFGTGRQPVIIYDAPISQWFVDFILTYGQRTGGTVLRYDAFLRAARRHEGEPVLLVLPMVQSGRRLAQVLSVLDPRTTNSSVTILTILTDRADRPQEKTRRLVNAGRPWDIHYFLQVRAQPYQPENCRLCQLGIPESFPAKTDGPLMLRTIDFWAIVDEAGWKLEENVPEYRNPLGAVPDFPVIVEKNGPWLATKIQSLLDLLPGGYPQDPVIVCPREKGSLVLGELLKGFLQKVTVITVPRSVINMARERQLDLSDFDRDRQDWFVQLSTLTCDDVIIIDEFNASGETRVGLMRLLQLFEKRVLSYLSIVDWNPKQSGVSGAICYSLYDFQGYEVSV